MNDALNRSVGALEEAVRNLHGLAIRMEDKGSEARSEILRKIEEINEEVDSINSKILLLQSAVGEMSPKVKEFDKIYQQSVGAKHMGKLIWAMLAASATGGMALVTYLFNWYSHLPVK